MDLLIYGVMQGERSNWWMLFVAIPLFCIPYFFIFRFLILKFDIKTPGREDDEATPEESKTMMDGDMSLAEKVLMKLGGAENVESVEACATRLRVTVKSLNGINKDDFRKLGASGTLVMGNNLQIIFGGKALRLKEQVRAIIAGKPVTSEDTRAIENIVQDQEEEIIVPMDGQIIPLSEVPDPVFGGGMMGDGFAVIPSHGTLYAPINGRIDSIFPTKHAICMVSDGGKEIILHMGIDTVKLEGEPFEVFVNAGDIVVAGQKLAVMDLDAIKAKDYSDIVSVVFTNMPDSKVVLDKKGNVRAWDKDFLHFSIKGEN
jgi:PTS system D-glucosamine-specific IIC component